MLIAVGVSFATPPDPDEKTAGLTMQTMSERQIAENRASYNAWDIAASLAVVGIVAYVMFYFSG